MGETVIGAEIQVRGRVEGKEDLRGFEWYYSRYLVDNSADVFKGHEDERTK